MNGNDGGNEYELEIDTIKEIRQQRKFDVMVLTYDNYKLFSMQHAQTQIQQIQSNPLTKKEKVERAWWKDNNGGLDSKGRKNNNGSKRTSK